MIVGVDEVGRGAWAGPLVVGAVILGGEEISGLTDSKKLTAKKRQELAREIRQRAKAIGLGWVSASRIDRIGLSASLTLATKRAIAEISHPYEQIIIDGTVNFIDDDRVTTMKQADLLVPSVSAASIVAKVARDYYMTTIVHEQLPEYEFSRHVGYGTALHAQRLAEYGASDMHRLSFAPVRKTLQLEPNRKEKSTKVASSGAIAEQYTAIYLEKQGYKIIERNWRTKVCEIDIIVEKEAVTYCVEVKYREKTTHGDGLSAITAKKLAQMKFAARVWQQYHQKNECNIQLAVVSVGNDPMMIRDFLILT